VELHATLLVSGDGLQVVGELVPGVQVRTSARSDLAELPVPVVQVALELGLPASVARLPVPPGSDVRWRLRQVELAERGLDICPLLGRG
jgi:hypothetical protein